MAFLIIIVGYCAFGQGYINHESYIDHEVKYGESLAWISYVYHISVDDIKSFNNMDNNIVYVGQHITIPIIKEYYCEDERDCIKRIYTSQIGVRELTGNNDGEVVEKYLLSAGLKRGSPWCASFIYWTFEQCGDTLSIKYPAWVPSYFPRSKIIYKRGKIKKRDPMYGDLIGIWFSSKGRLAHIGFFDRETNKYYITVEGNTNDAGSREGDGVYKKKRIKRQVHSISSWIDN